MLLVLDPKYSRSPGWRLDSATWGVELYWSVAECGRETPAALHAHMVNPEQSKLLGPAPA
jgi:hypothetical protein